MIINDADADAGVEAGRVEVEEVEEKRSGGGTLVRTDFDKVMLSSLRSFFDLVLCLCLSFAVSRSTSSECGLLPSLLLTFFAFKRMGVSKGEGFPSASRLVFDFLLPSLLFFSEKEEEDDDDDGGKCLVLCSPSEEEEDMRSPTVPFESPSMKEGEVREEILDDGLSSLFKSALIWIGLLFTLEPTAVLAITDSSGDVDEGCGGLGKVLVIPGILGRGGNAFGLGDSDFFGGSGSTLEKADTEGGEVESGDDGGEE